MILQKDSYFLDSTQQLPQLFSENGVKVSK